MWRRRTVAALIATLTLVAVATTPAQAGTQYEPFHGDLNGDGLTDRVTLPNNPGPITCVARVQLGRPGGGYLPARSHTYRLPNPDHCPDMGTIIDIGGDGTMEMVLTWYSGGTHDDLLVLRDFVVIDGYTQPFSQPGDIDTLDFNADGLGDLYLAADFGFVTFLNTPGGRLARGPLELLDCYPLPHWEFADFYGDGGLGALVVWSDAPCMWPTGGGVAVLGHDGPRVDLELGVSPDDSWLATAADFSGDGRPDVRTENRTTGEVTHFISVGHSTFGESPTARFDRPVVSRSRPTTFSVLANDFVTSRARVTVTVQPQFGRVKVNADRTVTYTPLRPNRGNDRFSYRLDQDGKYQQTAVSMNFTT